MAVPDYQSLMRPVLAVCRDGEIRVSDAVERLADMLRLSTEERTELLPSGRQTLFANRVHWAKTYLLKAGLIASDRRGYFRISEQGVEVLDAGDERIDNRFLNRFDRFRVFVGRTAQAVPPMSVAATTETPDEVMRAAHRQIEAALSEELLDRIRSAPPDFFERLIVNLLLAMGYGENATTAGRALGRTGDGGVDGVVNQDALGLDRIYIQAKRYAPGNTVGAPAIRDFFGSLDRHKAAKGVFVTTSTFSTSARETADQLSKRIVTIDGTRLVELMIRHGLGCRIEETLHIKKLDENFFE